MNEKKIAFIICSNSQLWYNECVKYIQNLLSPTGFELEVVQVTDAISMASGYNEGMRMSDAKYKIYMHQDMFLVYKEILIEIVELFVNNQDVGIIGLVGSKDIKNQAVKWDGWEYGQILGCNGISELHIRLKNHNDILEDVDCVDGMFIATQYDIPWREDIFTGWHFYDRSICMEHKRRGYRVVVPYQKEPWAIHDCGLSGLDGWSKYFSVFLTEYSDYFCAECKNRSDLRNVNEEDRSRVNSIANGLETLLNSHEYYLAKDCLSEFERTGILPSKKIIYIKTFLLLKEKSVNSTMLANVETLDHFIEKYTETKFLLRRIVYGLDVQKTELDYLNELLDEDIKIIINQNLLESMRIKEYVF